MKKSFITLILLLIVSFVVNAQTENWKKIKPIESNINDVEKILGPKINRDYFLRYKADDGIYFISFSDGKCVTEWKEEWNSDLGELPPLKDGTKLIDWKIPEWTVEKLSFYPKESLSLSSLGISLKKLKKVNKPSDTPDIFNYVDEQNGISYEIQNLYKKKGKLKLNKAEITGITLFPMAKYKKLLCK